MRLVENGFGHEEMSDIGNVISHGRAHALVAFPPRPIILQDDNVAKPLVL